MMAGNSFIPAREDMTSQIADFRLKIEKRQTLTFEILIFKSEI
jgi:hypothetical protein